MPRKGKRGGKSRHNDSVNSDEESTAGMGAKARPGLAIKGGGSGGGGDGRGGSGSACCPAVAPGVSIGGGGTAAKAWPLVTVDAAGLLSRKGPRHHAGARRAGGQSRSYPRERQGRQSQRQGAGECYFGCSLLQRANFFSSLNNATFRTSR